MASQYLDYYLDSVEGLPVELQRKFTHMKEVDASSYAAVERLDSVCEDLLGNLLSQDIPNQQAVLHELLGLLEVCYRCSAEKERLTVETYDLVDGHARTLDHHHEKYQSDRKTRDSDVRPLPATKDSRSPFGGTPTPRDAHRPGSANSQKGVKRKTESDAERDKYGEKKRKKEDKHPKEKKSAALSPDGDHRDDNDEPVYCYCNRPSFGDMVACDYKNCKIEWFHFGCVNLKDLPKGKWYCSPECQRAARERKKQQ